MVGRGLPGAWYGGCNMVWNVPTLVEKFGDKLKIKDDPMNKLLYYDAKIDGKRYKTMARYTKQSKEEAMSKITKKQQQLIGELTIQWE